MTMAELQPPSSFVVRQAHHEEAQDEDLDVMPSFAAEAIGSPGHAPGREAVIEHAARVAPSPKKKEDAAGDGLRLLLYRRTRGGRRSDADAQWGTRPHQGIGREQRTAPNSSRVSCEPGRPVREVGEAFL